MKQIRSILLITAAVLLRPVPCAAQPGTGAPPRDLAAALTPGARVRVSGPQSTRQYVGIVADRRGDSITVWTEAFHGVDGKALELSLPDVNTLDVSAGYEPARESLVVKFMVAGGLLAGLETAALVGSDDDFEHLSLYASRIVAGALLFALMAPRPAPRERWLRVKQTPQH